jgi:hypothetical protein
MKRTPIRLLVLAVTSALAALVLTAPAQAAAPYCGITWGSVAEQGPSGTAPAAGQNLTDVRTGRHTCYDRLVLDVRGTAVRSWRVEYVPQVRDDPRGDVIPLRGGAFLQIVVGASDHDGTDRQTYRPANRRELVDVTGFTTFRQVAWAGSFEGLTSIGLGVRAHLPFRVSTVSGIPGSSTGTRVVIDVANRW